MRPDVRASSLAKAPIDKLARIWIGRIRDAKKRAMVRDLYKGPSASVARETAARHSASWYVVSAGLGLVHSSQHVPSYDLTVSGYGPSSVLRKVEGKGPKTPDAWWQALNRAEREPSPIKRLIRRRRDALVVIALSTPYLRMVQRELSALSAKDVERVRILTSETDSLPNLLRPSRMPYDGRLNGPDSPEPGPMVSFAHRAASHFLDRVLRPNRTISLSSDARSVRLALKGLKRPTRKRRERATDQEIWRLSKKLRAAGAASASAALRQLRYKLSVACQHSRFVRIWNNTAQS